MATDDERPAAGDCGPLGCGYADILCRKHTRNHKDEQLERLKRLRKLRVELDDYRAGGCVGTPFPSATSEGKEDPVKRFVLAAVTAFGSVALAGAVAACGLHGTNAGNHFSDWVASNAGGNAGPIGVDGDQTDYDDHGNLRDGMTGEGHANGWANESYWIDITMPDGTPVTVKTYATEWAHTGLFGQLEAWLFDQAQKELRSWFNDYEPTDDRGDDYVG